MATTAGAKTAKKSARTKGARKAARQAERRRKHNAGQRSALRTALKTVVKAIGAGDKAAAQKAFRAAASVVDRVAEKDIIHKNKAARHKSRLAARIRALAG
jgi:small subunit ribosomal protein S20